MKEVFAVVSPIALIAGIAALIGSVFGFITAMQLTKSREELRLLRVALEKDPSPSQLGKAAQLWPAAGQFGQSLQKGEYVKRAHEEEAKRAHRTEVVKGWGRTLAFVAVVGFVLFGVGQFVRNMPDPAPTAPPTAANPDAP